ncbi:NAD(P)-dependent oxidoreductase, partial [Staphylococcus epidermidis]|uniref:NAD(P)-dependent oxidoreductase n=1 Tax=Staphylococcus epidermidis TaxID=1282 RepID=UPI0028CB544A
AKIPPPLPKRPHPFHIDLLYTPPHPKQQKHPHIGPKYVHLHTLLKNPDFITINPPYNPSLHHIIHTQQFNKIKS